MCAYTVRAELSVPSEDGVCRQRMEVLVHPMYEDFLRRAMENHTLVMCEGQKVYVETLYSTLRKAHSYDLAQCPHFEQVKEEPRTKRPPQLQIDLEADGVPLRAWAPMNWHDWLKERVGKEISFAFYEDPSQVLRRIEVIEVIDVAIRPREEILPRIRPIATSIVPAPPDGAEPWTTPRIFTTVSAQDERGCVTVALNPQPQQEKTVNSKIKIETTTFINGKPVDQHTVEDVVALIERSNAAIARMETFLEKVPSETVKTLWTREKEVRDQLVALLDSGRLKAA